LTAYSSISQAAWRTLGYGELQRLLRSTLAAGGEGDAGGGRSTAAQYLATLAAVVPR
jgi:hypothetical protein